MTLTTACAFSVASDTWANSTGKERDAESGNDYFPARYYASAMGRFLSPDPSQLYYADPNNPQSLNLYAYAQDNPLINIDPTGLDCIKDNGDGTFTPNSGDCKNENKDAANHEYYVDCDGCTSGGISNVSLPGNPGGVNFSTSNGSFYADPNGALFSLNTTGYGIGVTDETAAVIGNIDDMVTGRTPAPNNAPSSKFSCKAKVAGLAAMAGVGSALGVAPPGSDPAGDVASAVKDTAGSPVFRAAAGYYAARLGSAVLSGAGAARLGALVSDEVVPFVGWAATAYTAYSAVKDAGSYYKENSEVCQ